MGSVETVQQHLPGLDSPLTGDVSNDRNTMLHSFFALESKRTDPIEYKASGVEIVVQGTKSGIATINDKGILVYICSIASQNFALSYPSRTSALWGASVRARSNKVSASRNRFWFSRTKPIPAIALASLGERRRTS